MAPARLRLAMSFGKRKVMARIYNKTIETKERANEAYAALLTARCGDAYDPSQDVWRLEFELNREGAKGFKLYATPELDDDEAELEAELAAEELEHIGTLATLLCPHGRGDDLPDDPLAALCRRQWHCKPLPLATASHLGHPARRLPATGPRASPFPSTKTIAWWSVGHATAGKPASCAACNWACSVPWKSKMLPRPVPRSRRCSAGWRSSRSGRWTRLRPSVRAMRARVKPIPRWVWRGMEERYTRVEQIEHRVRMLLGVFGAYGVLPLEFKPAHTVGDLLVQHLDDLEQEAEAKGGVQQVLEDHFAKVYKVSAKVAASARQRAA